ncbi:MAG TPA: type II secretion system protein [Actinomycetota bacterium]|jgi:type IV pilus assembly protein PilA
MRRLTERLNDDEQGFTLIELMVVLMIFAILIVMGLPTYIGVKGRFQDRGAQSDLRNSVLAARIMFTDQANFTSANETSTGIVTIVNNQCYVAGGTPSVSTGAPVCVSGAGTGSISVASNASQFAAARMSNSTTCFLIVDSLTGTRYGSTTTAANCSATWAGTPGNVTATTPTAGGW